MITDRIFELREIGDSKALLKSREEELATPLLKDKTKLKDIYEIVKSECLNNKSLTNYDAKEYFITIAVFLYSPNSFGGDRFIIGLRDEVAKVAGISPERVSNIFRIVRDWVYLYRNFREGVEYLYSKVIKN